MIIKKEKPVNDSVKWSKADRKTLKTMVKEGKMLKEIAKELGRSVGSVGYQKSMMGLSDSRTKKVKEPREIKVKLPSGKKMSVKVADEPVYTPKDKAKDLARVARGIARENGKRITMAMFFIEDL
jgi:hypothetical protein